jgi:hypothetical protein
VAEYAFAFNPLAATHDWVQTNNVTTFRLRK